MTNFRFIEKNIDVSPILKQVLDNPEDWNAVSTWSGIAGDLRPDGFLPLKMAVLQHEGANIKNSELLEETPLYYKYTEIRKWLFQRKIYNFARGAFFKLPPGGSMGRHIDDGEYYLTKDRYHFSLQGRYLYEVDGEEHIIEPGTFFWFDNKKMHSATVIGDEDRITFVFDVPHSPNNP